MLKALGAVAAAAFALAVLGPKQASAQDTPRAPSSMRVAAVPLGQGVDWSRVAMVPASPEQSVAAYER